MINNATIPREAVRGAAFGLILMSVFTIAWASIANFGLQGTDHHFVLVIFAIMAIRFLLYSFNLYRTSAGFSVAASPDDLAEKKRSGKWFGIIFGLEGITIPIAINIVAWLGHPELTIPVIALVVGLHFYPMAWVFKRKIDYVLATWATLIALAAIVCALNYHWSGYVIAAFTGTGMALTTSAYAVYMASYSKKLISRAN